MSALRVIRAGPRTTVQDSGRIGFAHLGVPVAGAVDVASMRAANAAVGNAWDAAVLESTLGGDVLAADGGGVTVAVVGTATDDGVVTLQPGETLRVGRAAGAYVYVAVAGGVDVEPVLGSQSHDSLSRLGPPPLSTGQVLPVGSAIGTPYDVVCTGRTGPLHVLPGPHLHLLPPGVLDALVAAEWTVTPQADRVALRLAGPPIAPGIDGIASEGLVAGAVQLPPDGAPVLFLANHPVTGGYPVVAVVQSDDIGGAAQSRPGAVVRFVNRAPIRL
jgi:biotin-dependent carboxylase-like uncharacterized protein